MGSDDPQLSFALERGARLFRNRRRERHFCTCYLKQSHVDGRLLDMSRDIDLSWSMSIYSDGCFEYISRSTRRRVYLSQCTCGRIRKLIKKQPQLMRKEFPGYAIIIHKSYTLRDVELDDIVMLKRVGFEKGGQI